MLMTSMAPLPGLNLPSLNSTAKLIKLQRKVGGGGAAGAANTTTFKLTMTMTDNNVHVVRGAPALLEALVEVPHAAQSGGGGGDGGGDGGAAGAAAVVAIGYTLQWFNKTATKAPETIWLLNTPAVQDASGWKIHKVGAMINPLDADLSVGAEGASPHCDPSPDGTYTALPALR